MSEIDHSPTSPTEQDLNKALLHLYRKWCDDLDYRAERFRQMIVPTGNRRAYLGPVEAANKIVRGGITAGFAKLMLSSQLDLTVEALVISPRFRDLFSIEVRKLAQMKLAAARRCAAESPG